MKSFLFKKHNRTLFCAFVLILATYVFYILQIVGSITDVVNYTTFIGFGITILSDIFIITGKPKVKNVIEYQQNDDNVFTGLISSQKSGKNLLSRKTHRERLKSLIVSRLDQVEIINVILLTGESGSGKSTLLNLLYEDIKEDNYNVVKFDEYNTFKYDMAKSSSKSKDGKTIFLLDGFEQSLEGENASDFKAWCKSNEDYLINYIFVLSFPQAYISQVNNELRSISDNIHLDIYILNLELDDEDEYIDKIARRFRISATSVKGIWQDIQSNSNISSHSNRINNKNEYGVKLLCEELLKIKMGIAPLIEIEFLADIINRIDVSELESDNFLNKYFDDWVNQFENKAIAYSVLSLFTRIRLYSKSDIKYITFENNKSVEAIVDILSVSPFLQKYDIAEKSFILKHGYLIGVINRYLSDKDIPDGARCYIAYFTEKSNNNNFHQEIDKRYMQYNTRHFGLNFVLRLMIVCMFAISIIFPPKDVVTCAQRILITFVSYPSIFYIYNYCLCILATQNSWLFVPRSCLGGSFCSLPV
ncbi:MAG: ATP-binding protein, partial [Oscillospiraceae bacterium]